MPNGTYTVTLKFSEPHYTEQRQRVFGVKVQGKLVVDGLDLVKRGATRRALEIIAQDVQVTDGRLVIEFVPEVEYPVISAIAVEGSAGVRKINCGGPAWEDFQADWTTVGEAVTKVRHLPADDFYRDWARAEFGPEAALLGALFARLDGRLPRPAEWVGGPGGVRPDPRRWSEVEKQYAFVDEPFHPQPTRQGRRPVTAVPHGHCDQLRRAGQRHQLAAAQHVAERAGPRPHANKPA